MSIGAPGDRGLTDEELTEYVLRSDLHRAIAFASEMRTEAIELRRKLAERGRDPIEIGLIAEDAKLLHQTLQQVQAELKESRNKGALHLSEIAAYRLRHGQDEVAIQSLAVEIGHTRRALAECQERNEALESERVRLLDQLLLRDRKLQS